MRKFFADLFTVVGNTHFELARVLAAWAVVSYSGAFLWKVAQGGAVDWAALGVGFAAVLTGAGALIWAKDTARTKAIEAGAA